MKLWGIWSSMLVLVSDPFNFAYPFNVIFFGWLGFAAFVWLWIATGLLCMYIPCCERCVIRNKCGCAFCLATMFDDFEDRDACCTCGLRPPR